MWSLPVVLTEWENENDFANQKRYDILQNDVT